MKQTNESYYQWRNYQWRKNNPEKWKAIQKRYRERHKEGIKIRNYKWFIKNKEKINQKKRERYRKWREENPYKIAKSGTGWEIVRLKVLTRDDYICQICGENGREVHHLDGTGSNRKCKDMNNDLVNLITVCHKCHLRLDLLKKDIKSFNKGKWQEEKERNLEIIELSKKFSQTKISKIMGITRQRINQIINRSKELSNL